VHQLIIVVVDVPILVLSSLMMKRNLEFRGAGEISIRGVNVMPAKLKMMVGL